jgi:hypothetical protein
MFTLAGSLRAVSCKMARSAALSSYPPSMAIWSLPNGPSGANEGRCVTCPDNENEVLTTFGASALLPAKTPTSIDVRGRGGRHGVTV